MRVIHILLILFYIFISIRINTNNINNIRLKKSYQFYSSYDS